MEDEVNWAFVALEVLKSPAVSVLGTLAGALIGFYLNRMHTLEKENRELRRKLILEAFATIDEIYMAYISYFSSAVSWRRVIEIHGSKFCSSPTFDHMCKDIEKKNDATIQMMERISLATSRLKVLGAIEALESFIELINKLAAGLNHVKLEVIDTENEKGVIRFEVNEEGIDQAGCIEIKNHIDSLLAASFQKN